MDEAAILPSDSAGGSWSNGGGKAVRRCGSFAAARRSRNRLSIGGGKPWPEVARGKADIATRRVVWHGGNQRTRRPAREALIATSPRDFFRFKSSWTRQADSAAGWRFIGATAAACDCAGDLIGKRWPSHTDDTPVKVRDAWRKLKYTGRFWPYVGDPLHPLTVFDYTTSHKRDGPAAFLKDYCGYLQADAFNGYDGIYLKSEGRIIEVGCWAHARRKFHESRRLDSVRMETALAWIGKLYAVEKDLRERCQGEWEQLAMEERAVRIAAERQERPRPLLDSFHAWLEAEAPKVLPKSPGSSVAATAAATRRPSTSACWPPANVTATILGSTSVTCSPACRPCFPGPAKKNFSRCCLTFGSPLETRDRASGETAPAPTLDARLLAGRRLAPRGRSSQVTWPRSTRCCAPAMFRPIGRPTLRVPPDAYGFSLGAPQTP